MARANLSLLLEKVKESAESEQAEAAAETAQVGAPEPEVTSSEQPEAKKPAPAKKSAAAKKATGSTPAVSKPKKQSTVTTPQVQIEEPSEKPATDGESEAGPLYLHLERKEVRMREDQYDSLTTMARRLNKRKGTGGVRITANTLIRVGIDMVLAKGGDLSGATEEDLRRSVGL